MNAPALPHYLLISECRRLRSSQANAGKWRFVLEDLGGHSKFEAADVEPGLAGQRLELLTVIRGLEALDQPSRVTLITDSRYVTRGFRYGLSEWRENDWKWERFGQMVPIKNQDLWLRVDGALRFHSVECRVWQFAEAASVPEAAPQEPAIDQQGLLGRVRRWWGRVKRPLPAAPQPA